MRADAGAPQPPASPKTMDLNSSIVVVVVVVVVVVEVLLLVVVDHGSLRWNRNPRPQPEPQMINQFRQM